MLKKKSYVGLVSLVLVFVFIMSTEARAETFGFFGITHNDPSGDSVEAGEAQLTVDVTQDGSSNVKFRINNNDLGTDTVAMHVKEVYLYDGILTYVSHADSGDGQVPDGVDFPTVQETGFTGGQGLPGYKSITPLSLFLAAYSGEPSGNNGAGIDPGEWLEITLLIASGFDFDDVLDGIASQDIVIGIHVGGFSPDPPGYSEGFITPVPGAVLLGILGLGVAGLKLRKYA